MLAACGPTSGESGRKSTDKDLRRAVARAAVRPACIPEQVRRHDMTAVFNESVWNLGLFCDPCSAPPLAPSELRELGVFWINPEGNQGGSGYAMPGPYEGQGPGQVILTRLHVRYSAATFPEDLMFQGTQDTENYQVRHVLRHPWTGSAESCTVAQAYFTTLSQRKQTEAAARAELTGWKVADIYREQGIDPAALGDRRSGGRGYGSRRARGPSALVGCEWVVADIGPKKLLPCRAAERGGGERRQRWR